MQYRKALTKHFLFSLARERYVTLVGNDLSIIRQRLDRPNIYSKGLVFALKTPVPTYIIDIRCIKEQPPLRFQMLKSSICVRFKVASNMKEVIDAISIWRKGSRQIESIFSFNKYSDRIIVFTTVPTK